MNVGYFKNQTFKAQDGKEAKFIGGHDKHALFTPY